MKRIVQLMALLIVSSLAINSHSQEMIILQWDPVPDNDLAHYTMYRDSIPGTMVYLDSIAKTSISYVDMSIKPGRTYYYKITATDSAGNTSGPSNEVMAKTGTVTFTEADHNSPNDFQLGQSYPNPFNPSTTIEYRVPTATKVSLVVYDVLGNQIRRLVDDFKVAGLYRAVWDGRDDSGKQVASGVYLYQMIAGGFSEVRKTAFAK